MKSKEYIDKKTYAEDITEGKFSYPVIDAMQTNPDNIIVLSKLVFFKKKFLKINFIFTFQIDILKMKTENFEIKKYLCDYLESVGSLERTFKEMERLYDLVNLEIKRLGGNPLLEQTLKAIGLPEN